MSEGEFTSPERGGCGSTALVSATASHSHPPTLASAIKLQPASCLPPSPPHGRGATVGREGRAPRNKGREEDGRGCEGGWGKRTRTCEQRATAPETAGTGRAGRGRETRASAAGTARVTAAGGALRSRSQASASLPSVGEAASQSPSSQGQEKPRGARQHPMFSAATGCGRRGSGGPHSVRDDSR